MPQVNYNILPDEDGINHEPIQNVSQFFESVPVLRMLMIIMMQLLTVIRNGIKIKRYTMLQEPPISGKITLEKRNNMSQSEKINRLKDWFAQLIYCRLWNCTICLETRFSNIMFV